MRLQFILAAKQIIRNLHNNITHSFIRIYTYFFELSIQKRMQQILNDRKVTKSTKTLI